MLNLPVALSLIASASAEELSIVSWNIGADETIVTSSIEGNIADGLALMSADIVGLTDVKNEQSLGAVVGVLSEKHSLAYETRFCDLESNRHAAILFKEGLTVGETVALKDSGACAVTVTAGRLDFVLVVVNLKTSGARVEQARSVSAFLKGATLFAEKDAVLIGTTNLSLQRDGDAFAAMEPLQQLAHDALCNSSGYFCEGTSISGSMLKNMPDSYAISPGVAEYVDGSFERVMLHDELQRDLASFRTSVSNHIPLRARFSTDGRDDD